MRFIKTQNTWKASNFSMNMTTMDAYSYNWWLFVTKDSMGRIIVNMTNYSSSTCKHQNKALKLLDYKCDLMLRFTKKSLSDLNEAFHDEIRNANFEINELLKAIDKKGSRKSTNEKRLMEIENLNKHIQKVVSFMEVEQVG